MHHPRTSPVRAIVALTAAAALTAGAASCSGGDAADTATTATPPTTGVPSTTVAATTTVAPTTTVAETTTTVATVPVYPLTGVEVTDPAIAARPALVVKIDNATGARPQTGMNEADIVVEEIVNDSLTRFAFVFQSQPSDPVGPIRSGRLQDIDLFGAFNRPLFAWSGGNATVTAAIRASDLVDIGAPRQSSAYYRSGDRKVPHNLYSNTTALWGLAPADAQPPQQQFAYRSADEPAAGVPSPGVLVTLDSIDVSWDWDPAAGVYVRTMEGKPHYDTQSGQVNTNNVVVLEMGYLPGISGSPDAQTIGSGQALVFTGGQYIHGIWSRDDRLSPFTLTADDGSIIELTPGRTFIELPREGRTLVIPAG
ncbi:MAG: DUF3048 domain-containing protein [Ilumatobacteraceae bacterium]